MLFTDFYGLLRLGETAMPDNLNLRNTHKYSQRMSGRYCNINRT